MNRTRSPRLAFRPRSITNEGIIHWDELTNSSGREEMSSGARRGGVHARGTVIGRGRRSSNEEDGGIPRSASRNWSIGGDGGKRDARRGRGENDHDDGKGRGENCDERDQGTATIFWRTGTDRFRGEWNSGRSRGENQDAGRGRGENWDVERDQGPATKDWRTGTDRFRGARHSGRSRGENQDAGRGRGENWNTKRDQETATRMWGTLTDRFRGELNSGRNRGENQYAGRDQGEDGSVGRDQGTKVWDWITKTDRFRDEWNSGISRGKNNDTGSDRGESHYAGRDKGTTTRDWNTGTDIFRDEWKSGIIQKEDHKWAEHRGLGRNRDLSEGKCQGVSLEEVSGRHPGPPELDTSRCRQDENELETSRARGGNINFQRGFGARVARGAMYSSNNNENEREGGRAIGERGRGHRGNWNLRGNRGCWQSSAIRVRPTRPTRLFRRQRSISSMLSEWQTDAADVIVCKLNCNNQADLNQLLADDDIFPEDMCSFVKVLSVATTSDSSRQGVLDILITVFSEEFISKLLRFQLTAYTEQEEIDLKEFFRYQHVLLSSYFKVMPLNALDKIPELLQTIQLLLQKHVRENSEQDWAEIVKLYEGLLEHFNKYLGIKNTSNDKRKKLRNKLSVMDSINPDDDFREIPTEPTLDDITSSCKPFVRRNIVDGKYADVHTYLDVQFRLLREDFIRPLREGVHQYISNTPGRNHVRIYRNVQMINTDIVRGKLIYFVKLNLPKKIQLETSKRLMFGNLVCVSNDKFATFFLALVGERENKKLREGIIGISPLSRVQINFSSSYTVVESTAFFVAYKHVLAALQRMDPDKFPFAEHIVFVEPKVEPPLYLQNDPDKVYNLSVMLETSFSNTNRETIEDPCAVSVTAGIDEWPSCESFGFDQSQLLAFHAALTSRLALIQGPPGTGKTFLGLKIVQTLLHNSELWMESVSDSQPPILVVGLTNHALDQFLEGMLKFTKKIVRFGSMSKNINVQQFQVKNLLSELKCQKNVPRYLFDAKNSAYHNYSGVEDSFKNLQTLLMKAVRNDGLLRFSFLKRIKIIPPQIALQLTEVSYRDWILPSNERPSQLPPLAPVRSIWESKNESTQICNENVQNEAERLDALELADEEEEYRFVDNDHKFYSKMSNKIEPYTTEFEILTWNLDNEVNRLNEMKEYYEKRYNKQLSDEDQDRLHLLRYKLRCLRRLAYFTKTNVTDLKLLGKTNVHKLCFQDRCLLYSSWRNKLINTYQIQITALEDQLQNSVEGGRTDDLPDELLNTAYLVDLNAKIRDLQCHLAGVTENDGVLKWDTLVRNAVIPPDISKQMCKETYNTWILPLDPRIPAATIYPHIWKLWRNTPDSFNKACSESDLRKWKAKMEIVRMEIPFTNYDPKSPEFLSVSSEDQDYEVFLENYDFKLGQLNNLKKNRVISWRNYEVMSKKIRSEKDCLRRVLSFSKKDVTSLKIKDDVNVHDLTFADRCLLYATWKQELIRKYRDKCRPYELMVHQLNSKIEEIKRSQYLHIAREAEVVGMTTTGAAELQGLVQDLHPKIVVVEEAAQILEAHVVTALSASCEHLIMIGDHQQLRPTATVYELATKYDLETSMFERMTMNGLPYQTLEYQHRMRPEISRLLVPSIYPNLKDHESVALRPPVPGMASSVFFFTHDNKEETETDDNNSHSNPIEAAFTMQLARHLVLQGYSTDQITVLTPYSGQFSLLKQELEEQPDCEGMLVTKLDNYQGEENDIILLSLVRNNDQGNVGFLKIENRVCVALSRAKQGLYILGNIDQLCQSGPLWQKINQSLLETNSVGKTLTLYCQNHPDVVSPIKTTQDFLLMSPEGGCTQFCTASFPNCGHPCPRKCHVLDPTHEVTKCMLPCERKCEIGNHNCKALCWEDCPNCLERVTIELPCGHSRKIECYRSTKEDIHCPTLVEKDIPDCKHAIKMECSNDPLEAKCTARCSMRLDCGHACRNMCHVRNDPNHMKYSCLAPCARNNKNCSQEHECLLKCHEDCLVCPETVGKKASCGHSANVNCTFDMKDFVCKTACKRMLECGHRCPRKCFEKCGGCKVKVEKTLPSCGHVGKFPCGDDLKDTKCPEACSRLLECGHKCPRKCFEKCGGCKVKVEKTLLACGHVGKFPCGDDLKGVKCHKACNRLLECEHNCPRKCSEKCEGYCRVLVEKTLPECGHVGQFPCGVDLKRVKCQKLCNRLLKCEHKCPRKCSEECAGYCKVLVEKTLPVCGHAGIFTCGVTLTGIKCQKACKRLLECEHKCPRKCSDTCGSCQMKVKKTLSKCGHSAMVPCGSDKDYHRCEMPCKRVLKCGHNCSLKCSEECSNGTCSARVTRKAVCGHTALMECSDDMEGYKCKMSCKRLLQCSHKCPRKCWQKCGGCQTGSCTAPVTLLSSNKSRNNLACSAMISSASAGKEQGARQRPEEASKDMRKQQGEQKLRGETSTRPKIAHVTEIVIEKNEKKQNTSIKTKKTPNNQKRQKR